MNNITPLPNHNLEDIEDQPLGLETLRAVVPKGRRQAVTQKFVDTVNGIIEDPDVRETFKNNLLGYADVLSDPKISLTAYVQAVRYNSYKFMGLTNFDSFVRTFPERYERMVNDGKSIEHIKAIVSQYNGGKTVNAIWEQSLIPTYVLNYDIYQEAVNELATLMRTAKSEKVRSDSASSLLTALKQPDNTKMKVDISIKERDGVAELREENIRLAKVQREAIERKIMDAEEVAQAKVIPGDFERLE